MENKIKNHNKQTKLIAQHKSFLPWIIWFLGAFFYFYENIIQVSPGVMVQDLMQSLSLDAAGLGILAGVYFYTYAFIQIPAGVMADNYNIRYLLLSAITFCVLGCFLFGTSEGMIQALLGRLLIGLGSGFAAICSMKLATIWFEAKKFPFLVGLMVTLGMSGSIVGEGPLAILVDKTGWRESIFLLGFLGVILALFVFYFVKGNKKSTLKSPDNNQHILSGLYKVIACKQSWFLAIYGGLMFAPTSIFGGLWGVPYIMQAYNIGKPLAASLVSLLFLGWVIGGPISGLIATNMKSKKPLLIVGSLGALLSISIIIYIQALPIFLLGFFIFTFGLFSSCFLPSFSIIKELHGDNNSGAALGFMNTANMTGGAIGLPLVGFLLNSHWNGAMLGKIKIYSTMDYMYSLSLLPIMISISLILVFFVKEIKHSD